MFQTAFFKENANFKNFLCQILCKFLDCRNRIGLIDLTYQKNVFNSNCHFIVPTTNFFILWRFNIINFFDQFFRPTIKGTIFRMTLSRPVIFPTNHYQADHHDIQKSIIMCLINLFTVNLAFGLLASYVLRILGCIKFYLTTCKLPQIYSNCQLVTTSNRLVKAKVSTPGIRKYWVFALMMIAQYFE